eukprot:300648_1
MSRTFPTRGELKCAGISFIISQTCFIITIALFSADYDIYNVDQESDVVTLHKTLSRAQHRTNIELSATFVFISFPFLLISLHGLHKLLSSIFDCTPGEMIVYLIETSYTIWITVSTIVIPALCLVAISFEWSFDEYTTKTTENTDVALTGYYMQAYVMLYQLEMIDCTAIADATFMISIFITPFIIHFGAIRNHKLKRIQAAFVSSNARILIIPLLLILIFVIIFAVVLFQFTRSGFQSPTGHAKYLLICSFLCKILIGIRLFIFGFSDSYDRINAVMEGFYSVKTIETIHGLQCVVRTIQPEKWSQYYHWGLLLKESEVANGNYGGDVDKKVNKKMNVGCLKV